MVGDRRVARVADDQEEQMRRLHVRVPAEVAVGGAAQPRVALEEDLLVGVDDAFAVHDGALRVGGLDRAVAAYRTSGSAAREGVRDSAGPGLRYELELERAPRRRGRQPRQEPRTRTSSTGPPEGGEEVLGDHASMAPKFLISTPPSKVVGPLKVEFP